MNPKGFSYSRLIRRRDALYGNVLRHYGHARIAGETVNDLVDALLAELPPNTSRDALYESIRPLAGTSLGPAASRELAWRLAGNIDRLEAGEPVLPWTRQIADEIVPVRVERVKPEKRKDTFGYVMFCRVLAGSPCPMVFPQFFSDRSCRAVSRQIGFSNHRGLYPYSSPLHYVNLMFFAHIEAERSRELPYFRTVSCSSGLKTENRPKIAIRCRARPCPFNFEHACIKCWVGYNECPAGIYPQTLVQQHCMNCNADGFFEPDDVGLFCMQCRHRQHTPESV